ncbi:hypothetical protein GCM10009548_20510 [Streptomyces malaysiensis subsp. malaysiensis]
MLTLGTARGASRKPDSGRSRLPAARKPGAQVGLSLNTETTSAGAGRLIEPRAHALSARLAMPAKEEANALRRLIPNGMSIDPI